MREAFYVVQHKHRPHPLRQLGHRLSQPSSQLVSLGRIPKAPGERLVQFISRAYLSAPREVQRRVRDDPVQPRSESLLKVEAIESLICPHERLLYCVLSVFMHSDDCPRHSVSTLGMQPDEHAKRCLVAPLGGAGKGSLVRSITRRIGHALN